MFFKKSIQKKVYRLYLEGLPLNNIAMHLNLDVADVDEIIDYINEIYA